MNNPFLSDNGVLGRVPGEYVARGEALLPDPNTAPKDAYDVEADGGPDLGRVLLHYERKTAKKGRHSHKFWSCARAERLDAPF